MGTFVNLHATLKWRMEILKTLLLSFLMLFQVPNYKSYVFVNINNYLIQEPTSTTGSGNWWCNFGSSKPGFGSNRSDCSGSIHSSSSSSAEDICYWLILSCSTVILSFSLTAIYLHWISDYICSALNQSCLPLVLLD